ncbi:hypothetical protein ACET3Z_009451 [Daucus carota]
MQLNNCSNFEGVPAYSSSAKSANKASILSRKSPRDKILLDRTGQWKLLVGQGTYINTTPLAPKFPISLYFLIANPSLYIQNSNLSTTSQDADLCENSYWQDNHPRG